MIREKHCSAARRSALTLVVAFLVAAGLVACGGSPAPAETPHAYLTEKDSPAKLATDVGALVTISLAENPSTGYTWTMALGPGLTLLSDTFVQPSTSPDGQQLVGAAGQRSWTLRVDGSGTTTVVGAYARPWEAEGEPAAEFSLTIEAAAAE